MAVFFVVFIRAGVEQFSSGKANDWRNRERVVLDLTLRGAPNTTPHHSPHHRHHMHSHTQHNITHRERTEKERREREKRKHMFHVFFVCDGVGAVDFPQRVHPFRFSLQFKTLFSNVDVIQHVKKCLKLQREAKIWTR